MVQDREFIEVECPHCHETNLVDNGTTGTFCEECDKYFEIDDDGNTYESEFEID